MLHIGNTPLHLSVMLGRKGKPIEFYQFFCSVHEYCLVDEQKTPHNTKAITITTTTATTTKKSAIVCIKIEYSVIKLIDRIYRVHI